MGRPAKALMAARLSVGSNPTLSANGFYYVFWRLHSLLIVRFDLALCLPVFTGGYVCFWSVATLVATDARVP